MITSIATVGTATPSRYAMQLASHLGRKAHLERFGGRNEFAVRWEAGA